MDTSGNLIKIRSDKKTIFKGLKRKWIWAHFPALLLILILLLLGIIYGFYNTLYSDIQNNISNTNNYYLDLYYKESKDIKDFAKSVIKDFNSKNNQNMELQIIDEKGNMIANSSGVLYKNIINDLEFKEAINGNTSIKKLEDQFNNPIIAISYPIKVKSNNVQGVMRYIVSTENINQELNKLITIASLVLLVTTIMLTILTYYFNKIIVTPVNEINEMAKKMSEGQFSERIEKDYYDELGELANTINYLSEQIVKMNSIKNEFISSVTHELKTPLTSIKGWGETILDGNFIDKQESELGLRIIIKETYRLEKLVEELLDFSKMESGKLVLYLDEINLSEEIDEVVKIMEKMGDIQGVKIIYEKKDNIPNILGDTDRLKQVFINIINNAIKFTSKDKKIKIDVKNNDEDEYIYVDIIDEGEGISETDLEFVKEKFYKGKSRKSGSGLGLAISNEIMQLHKGEIFINSEERVGTTVTLKFPKIKEN